MSSSERAVFWKTRLQPFRAVVVSIWTTLSLQISLTSSFVTYSAVFALLLGFTLLDGTFVHQLGVLLLLTALCYALLVAGLKYGGLGLGESLSCDQEAVLHDVCVQVATVEHLVLSLIAGTARKRSQQPVTFYIGGMLLVFVLGRLGMWLTFHTLMWMTATILLAMPALLSRGWISEKTLDKVWESASATARPVQTFILRHTRN